MKFVLYKEKYCNLKCVELIPRKKINRDELMMPTMILINMDFV